MSLKSMRNELRRLADDLPHCPHCRRPLNAVSEEPQDEIDWNAATIEELDLLRDIYDAVAARQSAAKKAEAKT